MATGNRVNPEARILPEHAVHNPHTPKRRHRSGYTAIEVFLVISLIAATLGLVIAHFFPSADVLEKRPALVQLQRAVAEAHRMARTQHRPVTLGFDAEGQRLVLHGENGTELAAYGFPEGSEARLSFYRLLPEQQVQQEPTLEAEETEVQRIAFHPHGFTAPFLVEYETGYQAQTLRFDPFSALTWTTEVTQ